MAVKRGKAQRRSKVKPLPKRSAHQKKVSRLTYENTARAYAFKSKSIKEARKHQKKAKKWAKKGQAYIPREGSLTAFKGKKAKQLTQIDKIYSQRWETKLASHAVAHTPFKTEQPVSGESTAIYSMAYNKEKKVLWLTFWKYKMRGAGSTYMYYNVPIEVWNALVKASSKGRFFWYNIRGQYNFRRVR